MGFIKKPTANLLLVKEMGALPARARFSTLAVEVASRLRNTCEEVDDTDKAGILTRFSKAMQSSRYDVVARAEALWSGLRGHRTPIARREAGDVPESDQEWETRGRRQVRKMEEKRDWFQKESQNKKIGNEANSSGTSWRHNNNSKDRGPPITVLYVSAIPGGEFARRLQEADLKFADLQ